MSSSLTRVRSYTLGRLPQPTCVGLRYGRRDFWQRGFSRRHRINGIPQGISPRVFLPPQLITPERICLSWLGLQVGTHHVRWARFAYLSVSPLCVKTKCRRYGNIDPLSIAFACSLRLRPDLPYDDQRSVGNLGLSVSWILTRIVATHAGILTSQRSITTHVVTSPHWQRSPTIPPFLD